MKHTPGPWEYKFDMAGHDVRAKSKLIAALGVLPEITQNGHLIAAAPDMLEALKEAENIIGGPIARLFLIINSGFPSNLTT